MIRLLLSNALLFLFTCTSLGFNGHEKVSANRAKNIILLIGDGMGLSQVSAAYYYSDEPSNFSRFNDIGLIRTSSAKEKITDSAAGATAFSIGEKSYNGAIGVNADTIRKSTIVEILSRRDYSTGVISTSSITHATPASFYAHVPFRKMEEEIAAQLVTSDIDFFAGGGMKFFKKREDKTDQVIKLVENGFNVYTSSLETEDLNGDSKYGFILSDDGMPKVIDGRNDFLADATRLAIQHLSQNEEGFFLMVEGSQIDWGGHANDEEYLVSELLDFDKAIGVALDFANEDRETLVIVTADHETGGFTLADKDDNYNEIKGKFSTGGHSATLIPVFADGPSSELFRGIYENTEIFDKMMKAVR